MVHPLISIIIPVYNVKDYLDTCLNSVINQTYKELEIIIINDGSTDGSDLICDAYAKKDSRIKLIHQSNAGPSASRNRGLQVATGEYINFVDSDDYIDSDTIEFLYERISQTKSNIVACDFYDTRKHTSKSEVIIYDSSKASKALYSKETPKFIIADLNAVWAKLYQRDLFNKIRFPEGVLCEDMIVSANIYSKIEKMTLYVCPKYHYIQRQSSTMHTPFYSRYYYLYGLFAQYDIGLQRKVITQYPVKGLKITIHFINHVLCDISDESEQKKYIEIGLSYLHKYDSYGPNYLGYIFVWKKYLIGRFFSRYKALYNNYCTLIRK